jgi:AcrR family transcriptional regulator
MPRHVHRRARRRQVVEIAAELIAEGGLDAVTFRDVAAAADCSTGIVSHYFRNKRDLLFEVYRSSSARPAVEPVLADDPTRLPEALLMLLPITHQRELVWRVYFAFWGKAIGDEALALEHAERVRDSQRMLAKAVRALQDRGQVHSGMDAELAGQQLVSFVIGTAAQAVFDPEDWPPERQSQAMAEALRSLGLTLQLSRGDGQQAARPSIVPEESPGTND